MPSRPIPPLRPPTDGSAQLGRDDNLIWDLPGDKVRTKQPPASRAPQQRQAAARKPAAPAQAEPEPNVNSDLIGQAANQRMNRILDARDVLSTDFRRLQAKKAELIRWDRAAQEKFQRAFGSADLELRQQVLIKLDGALKQTANRLAQVQERLDFEVFMQSKNRG